MWKNIMHSISVVGLIILGFIFLQGDFVPFLQWWVTIFSLGIIFIPLTSILFSSFHDKGYLFSKTIGIAVTGYFMWLLSSLHILKFTEISCILSVIIGLVLNCIVFFFYRKKSLQNSEKEYAPAFLKHFNESTVSSIITEELLFFGLFLLFVYIRGFKPEAYGTEKFMDYGFMTTMMRSEYMPPQDLWFSGTSINYYYVGQYMATFLTKLSFVKASYGYNLMLMMTGAFSVVLPYSLCFNLISKYYTDRGKKSRIIPGIGGLIAGAGVTIAGNMHYPIYKWLIPYVKKILGLKQGPAYWFPDATRYIGYNPETHDKTIHEFPSYSFVLGDLHAHVINILFVLTVLGMLFAWLKTRERENKDQPVWKEVFHPIMIMIGFFIGLFHTTNFWDFPIYYVVCGAVILFSNMVVYNFKVKALWLTALQGIFIVVFSELVCLPFTLSFDQISTNIRLAVAHTPFYQLAVLWGLPIFMVLAFLVFQISNFFRKKEKPENADVGEKKAAIFRLMESLSSSDLFIITIGLCAIGLILIPEIIYVEDIYSGDYKRANTMFKLTYQAFIMFGISFGYIFVRLLRFGETRLQRIVSGAGLILFTLTLFYSGNAVKSWFGNIFDPAGFQGLDASAFMKTTMPDDYPAIQWLNENVKGLPVVLEANGDSYTDYERVSVMTGLPTVLGWRTHEWLWKSNTDILDQRADDIQTIYTSVDEAEVKNLINENNIQYIYVGKLEKEKYGTVNDDLLKKLGDIVYDSPVSADKAYETYIVKIRN
jgi:YYY domain-containing protein